MIFNTNPQIPICISCTTITLNSKLSHYAIRRDAICPSFALLLEKYILLLQIILALHQGKSGIVKRNFWHFCDSDKVDN